MSRQMVDELAALFASGGKHKFMRYAKLGTVPYGTLTLKSEPRIGDRLKIPESSVDKRSRKINVVVTDINENCVFLARM